MATEGAGVKAEPSSISPPRGGGVLSLPAIPARAGAGDFFRGLALPFRATRFIFGSPKLFLLGLLSSAVTFASLVALVWLLASYTDDLIGTFWSRPDAWYLAGLWYLAVALCFVVLLVVGANTVPLLLLSPLQDPISEATEELCGGFKARPFSVQAFARGIATSLAHTAGRVAILLAGQLVLLPLNLLPGIGSILWAATGTAWTIWWLAGEYLSAPMARHLYPFSLVRKALWNRKALAIGFGCAVYALLWVPVLNFFFIPLATVGGTLLFRGLRQAGSVPASPADLAG
ncbi:MAG: EI24 domain-containing protein [Myxococcales bacterium]|nr:EI24 domain-containing protein [Myxococcales bacterium]